MHIYECRLRLHAAVHYICAPFFFSGWSNEFVLRAKIIVAWCNFINHTFKMQNSIWIIASFFFVRMHFFGISKVRLYHIFTNFFYVWEKSGHALIVRDYVLLLFVGKKTCEAIRIRFTVFFGWITNCMTFCYPHIP